MQTKEKFMRLLDKRIDMYLEEGLAESYPDYPSMLYTIKTDKKAWLESYGVGDIPDPLPFDGITKYQEVSPGYWSKIEPREWAGGIIIERLLWETEQYGAIEDMVKGLPRAMKRIRNKHAIDEFANASSTAFNFVTSEEGVALCSTAHTTKADGVSTTTGFSNLSVLTFDAVNLEAVRLQGIGIKSDIGERVFDWDFDTIWYGSTLAAEVNEAIESQRKPDTNFNNDNYQAKLRWKTLEIPMLDDYGTKTWGILDSKKMKKYNLWHDLIKPEYDKVDEFDTKVRKRSSYGAWGCGPVGWRWIVAGASA